MIRTVLLVPEADNAGALFPRPDWSELETRLQEWGGFTREPNVTGVWVSGGRRFEDISRRYVVALAGWWDLPRWLAMVDWARERFRQDAMYVEVAAVPEVRGPAGQ